MGTHKTALEIKMSRFETEISQLNCSLVSKQNIFFPNQLRPIIGTKTYNQVQQKLSQVQVPRTPVPPPLQIQPSFLSTFVPTTTSSKGPVQIVNPTPIVLSSAPKFYQSRPSVNINQVDAGPHVKNNAIQFDVKKLKAENCAPNPIAAEAINAARASSALQSFQTEKKKKDRKTVRVAGGQTWEDSSLTDWPDNDYRIFCGDLGNDVNDEILTRVFNKYPSFQKARVIRDRRTGKGKGFGFVSFKEPGDYMRAMKEVDGHYVGSRPIKLRKSTWMQRNLDVVKRKEKEKQKLLQSLRK